MKRRDSPEYYGVDRAPEFLQQVADHAAQVIMTRTTIDDLSAIELGQRIAARIAEVFAGSKVRIPSGTWNGRGAFCFSLSKRDLAIYRMYNGRNWRDICAAYAISRSNLFRIVRAVHDRLQTIQSAISRAPSSLPRSRRLASDNQPLSDSVLPSLDVHTRSEKQIEDEQALLRRQLGHLAIRHKGREC